MACEAILEIGNAGNVYMDERAPWSLFKQGGAASEAAAKVSLCSSVSWRMSLAISSHCYQWMTSLAILSHCYQSMASFLKETFYFGMSQSCNGKPLTAL